MFELIGDNTYRVNATGDTAEARETALDSVLSTGGICFEPTDGVSGNFAEGLCVTAISTELGTFFECSVDLLSWGTISD